jgi:hypothetical protein
LNLQPADYKSAALPLSYASFEFETNHSVRRRETLLLALKKEMNKFRFECMGYGP